MKKILLTALCLLFVSALVLGQAAKKKANAIRVTEAPRIDGVLDEAAWKDAPVASDFTEYIPYNDRPGVYRTEVRFLYDNTALYVGAIMYDPSPDSILVQKGLRDTDGLNADQFGFSISPFNDGVNAFVFFQYASDVQMDYKISSNSTDLSWDAVWESKAKITKEGWIAEFKIPFSAIRFPKKAVQEWGFNCSRDVRRYRERSSWNRIDKKVDGVVNQQGLLEGIENVKPPLRLSLSPYLSGYVEKNPENTNWQFTGNYGADLKLGLNQSFTLDMTLIPDFGQVASDDKVYNFSPFEIRYDEKRQFFTEGTELFNKSGIFYSRRIGGMPRGYGAAGDSLGTDEVVKNNPQQTKLINASKISGRTNKGLGIGIFNAISANTWATVEDTITGKTRRVLTQGFTNYNMIVLDQALKNNSYIDFLNTNYYEPTVGYMANVTGTNFKFFTKKHNYTFSGDAIVSQKYYSHDAADIGYHHTLNFAKVSGNMLFSYYQLLETSKYDPNDMGYNARNNRFLNLATFNYNKYDPFWKLLEMYTYFYVAYSTLYDGLKYNSLECHGEGSVTTKKERLSLGVGFNVLPVPYHDYYEPRVAGYMYIQPAEYNINPWISTDYRKPLAIDAWFTIYKASRYRSWAYNVGMQPRYRVNDRLTFSYNLSYELLMNNVGYATDSLDVNDNPVIIFGKRDIQTITNTLSAKYMFNSNMSLDLKVRHYWVTAPYKEFYRLKEDGNLDPSSYCGDQDINYNLFNIDFVYNWHFAPGSQLSVVWKNAVSTFSNEIEPVFFNNLDHTLNSPASNSFSIRLLYYLDALYLKKKR